MQNDLISRSALIEALQKEEYECEEVMVFPSFWSALRIVKEQPTAYDVEKVDKQIVDYFKTQVEKSVDAWNVVDFSCDIRKIVRNGGNADVPDIYFGNNGWIPVRFPENNRPVLCWVRSTTIECGETYIIGSYDSGCWFLQTYEIGHHHFPVKDYEVIAWQPLPEPFKGE